MLKRLALHVRAEVSRLQSHRKNIQHYRQKKDEKPDNTFYLTLAEIRGENPEDTFERRMRYLRGLSPHLFEYMVLDAFCRKKKAVIKDHKSNGIDAILYMENRMHGIHCVPRLNGQISMILIKWFNHNLDKADLDIGYFVHTGRTPSGLYKLYNGRRVVHILSGQDLIDFLI